MDAYTGERLTGGAFFRRRKTKPEKSILIQQQPTKSQRPNKPLPKAPSKPQRPTKPLPKTPTRSNKSNQQLKIMSVNIQSYDTCKIDDICGNLFGIINFSGADIICLQEDLENNQESIKGLYNYILVSSCHAEQIYDTYLVNRIFVHKSIINLVEEIKNLDISNNCKVPRCAVYIKVNNMSLVNLHLCGGRFDDVYYRDLHNTRYDQIQSIFKHLGFIPDLIVGDFNIEATIDEAKKTLQSYPFYTKLSPYEKQRYIQYATSHHALLNHHGYQSAYTQHDIGPTSKFGGTPDLAYYQPNRLMPISFNKIYLLEYTDHNGVIITFEII